MYNVYNTKQKREKMIVVKDKEKLRNDIFRAGYTFTRLAKNIGCSKAHISSIINHERNPSAVIAVKICEQIKGQFDEYFFIESVHKKKQRTDEKISQ